MRWKYYENYLGEPVKGKKTDVTPLFQHKQVFRNLIHDLSRPFEKKSFDKVVGIDAIGFILASAMAYKMQKGMISVRKGGALPVRRTDVLRKSFVDYSSKRKSLEMNKSAIKKGERVIIADDWIETGANVKAAIKMIELLGGNVVGITTIGFDKKKAPKDLLDYDLFAINFNA